MGSNKRYIHGSGARYFLREEDLDPLPSEEESPNLAAEIMVTAAEGLQDPLLLEDGEADPEFDYLSSDMTDQEIAHDAVEILDEGALREPILPPEEWIEKIHFAGPHQYELWPGVKADFVTIVNRFLHRDTSKNEEGKEAEEPLNLGILTGGIGAGKTRCAEVVLQYLIYWLLCHASPAKAIGMVASATINIAIFSTKFDKAKKVMYKRLRRYIDSTPWFNENHPPDHNIRNSMEWPEGIVVAPYPSTVQSAISEDMWLAVLDEANFWISSPEADRVDEVYLSLRRRMSSRFEEYDERWLILAVSSATDHNSFTEKVRPDAGIILSRSKWEAKGETFEGEPRFLIDLGNQQVAPRIVTDRKDKIHGRLLRVPVRFQKSAKADLSNFLRETYGIGVQTQRRLYGSWLQGYPWEPPTSEGDEFYVDPDPAAEIPKPRLLDSPIGRCIHVDLAVSGDWAGISCGYVEDTEWKEVEEGIMELVPRVVADFVIRWRSKIKAEELPLEKVRELIIWIAQHIPVLRVTFDGWQSKDSIQQLNKRGIVAELLSVDRSPAPHHYLKRLLAERRILVPYSSALVSELINLIVNPTNGKIDHPKRARGEGVKGSKDMADALAGMAYSCHQTLEGTADVLAPADLEFVILGQPRNRPVEPGNALAQEKPGEEAPSQKPQSYRTVSQKSSAQPFDDEPQPRRFLGSLHRLVRPGG